MKRKWKGLKKVGLIVESVGIGLFYVGILAFFLYPVVEAAAYTV